VSEMLVAKKARRARGTAKELKGEKKTDAASLPAAPVGGTAQ
jgi:hypothetical protein